MRKRQFISLSKALLGVVAALEDQERVADGERRGCSIDQAYRRQRLPQVRPTGPNFVRRFTAAGPPPRRRGGQSLPPDQGAQVRPVSLLPGHDEIEALLQDLEAAPEAMTGVEHRLATAVALLKGWLADGALTASSPFMAQKRDGRQHYFDAKEIAPENWPAVHFNFDPTPEHGDREKLHSFGGTVLLCTGYLLDLDTIIEGEVVKADLELEDVVVDFEVAKKLIEEIGFPIAEISLVEPSLAEGWWSLRVGGELHPIQREDASQEAERGWRAWALALQHSPRRIPYLLLRRLVAVDRNTRSDKNQDLVPIRKTLWEAVDRIATALWQGEVSLDNAIDQLAQPYTQFKGSHTRLAPKQAQRDPNWAIIRGSLMRPDGSGGGAEAYLAIHCRDSVSEGLRQVQRAVLNARPDLVAAMKRTFLHSGPHSLAALRRRVAPIWKLETTRTARHDAGR